MLGMSTASEQRWPVSDRRPTGLLRPPKLELAHSQPRPKQRLTLAFPRALLQKSIRESAGQRTGEPYLTTVVEVLPTGVVVEYVVVAGVVVTTVAGAGSRLSTVVVFTLHAPSSPIAPIERNIRIIARSPRNCCCYTSAGIKGVSRTAIVGHFGQAACRAAHRLGVFFSRP